MMTAHEKTTLLTAEQFWELVALPEYANKRFELINGEIVVVPESSSFNSIIAVRFAAILRMFVDEFQLGWVTGPDGGYRLDDGNVRQPDAAFISKERLPILTRRIGIAPDIAVEVIPPSETTPAVSRKAALYLQSGTRIVWTVYPPERSILVWTSGEAGALNVATFQENDLLDGGNVLPGFTLAIAKLFECLPEKMD